MQKTPLIDLDSNVISELESLLGLPPTGIISTKLLHEFANWKRKNNLGELEYIGQYSLELLRKQKVPKLNLEIIKEFEGFSTKAYLCPVGVPTIGYGTTVYSNGVKVKLGDIITKEKAEKELLEYINNRIIPILKRTIPYWDEMNNNQKSALISFAYNLGEYFYGKSGFSSISKVLREKNWKSVPSALLLYINPGSNFAEGLKRRRIAEGKLFMSP